MPDDDLLTIGRFAHLSGLSIHTLRHYNDVDLLNPADVAVDTGYRRYHRDQIQTARLIAALRWIDLPVHQIRPLLVPNLDPTTTQTILRQHRGQLERRQRLTSDQLRDIDRFLQKGLTMPTLTTRLRPCQTKLAVDDLQKAADFYRDAFEMRYDVIRRTEDQEYYSLVLGEPGNDDFFLIVLQGAADDDLDRPTGTSTLGLLVNDIDAAHVRAISAGGTELFPPHDPEGMPRCSAVGDPSGNWIWLYQG